MLLPWLGEGYRIQEGHGHLCVQVQAQVSLHVHTSTCIRHSPSFTGMGCAFYFNGKHCSSWKHNGQALAPQSSRVYPASQPSNKMIGPKSGGWYQLPTSEQTMVLWLCIETPCTAQHTGSFGNVAMEKLWLGTMHCFRQVICAYTTRPVKAEAPLGKLSWRTLCV